MRVTATVPGPEVTLEAPQDAEPRTATRTAIFGEREHEAKVLRGELPAGTEIAGPGHLRAPRGHAGRAAGLERRRPTPPAP